MPCSGCIHKKTGRRPSAWFQVWRNHNADRSALTQEQQYSSWHGALIPLTCSVPIFGWHSHVSEPKPRQCPVRDAADSRSQGALQDYAIVTVVVTAVDPKTCIQGSEFVAQRKHDTELTGQHVISATSRLHSSALQRPKRSQRRTLWL